VIAPTKRARRIPFAVFAVAIAAVTVAPICFEASAGAISPSSGRVLCQTLAKTEAGKGYTVGGCGHIGTTGGSATVGGRKLFSRGGDVTFHWASRKITEADVSISIFIGACGGPNEDNIQISGPIVRDTTGRITQPVFISLCGTLQNWTVMEISI
jgi:hypothetical protein